MRIVVVGAGYVGLVTGACLADTGHHVVCVDTDAARLAELRRGRAPFYEAGLNDLLDRNLRAGRLEFDDTLSGRLAEAELVFIAVGTPSLDDGGADLTAVMSVAREIASSQRPPRIVVVKSTVPIGTCAALQALFDEQTGGRVLVASNPEFLREGVAVRDFNYPDRIVIGAAHEEAASVLRKLYAPFVRTLHPILVMSRESAEMTKYASNCLLASRISFMNEMANLSRALGADIGEVRMGMGFDHRIGFPHLFPGVGYGGSCFPKDVQAMIRLGESHGVEVRMLRATHEVNVAQRRQLAERLIAYFGGSCRGRTIALWGVTFKPQTDDLRESPALVIIDLLLAAGATIRAYDPLGLDRLRQLYGDRIGYATGSLDALNGADALAVVTEWNEFRTLDPAELRRRMKRLAIFDGRNLYDRQEMRREGIAYFSIGHPDIDTPVS
jgi:UDPglucose 6-dehydrogenase